ncbi:MAG: glycosyltransferase [Candidatus Krumholzibacteriota bacterium]|nr:glycosyltransferase [Candidatus Krumholzibacteriota bacterium]
MSIDMRQFNGLVSIGVFAYNEEIFIKRMLDSLVKQRGFNTIVKEVLVFTGGSDDETNAIVGKYVDIDNRITLHVTQGRRGKAYDINQFVIRASGEYLVMNNGDTLLDPDSLLELIAPFSNPEIGMTGGRSIPLNDYKEFMGKVSFWLWQLHHQVCLINPKMGEIVSWRASIVKGLDVKTSVDEALIECTVKDNGYKVEYAPKAIVYNYGPKKVSDFIKQRRRIFCGHFKLKHECRYSVSTISLKRILKASWRSGIMKHLCVFCGIATLEIIARLAGVIDYLLHRDHSIWNIAATTKSFDDEEATFDDHGKRDEE